MREGIGLGIAKFVPGQMQEDMMQRGCVNLDVRNRVPLIANPDDQSAQVRGNVIDSSHHLMVPRLTERSGTLAIFDS